MSESSKDDIPLSERILQQINDCFLENKNHIDSTLDSVNSSENSSAIIKDNVWLFFYTFPNG